MTTTKNRRGRWALVLVLLLVNGAAVWGQAGWAMEHIVPAGWDWRASLALALAFASAIELIGVFLALSADDAEDRSIPSGGIRLSSYAIGIVSGALNYSHWDGAAAIAFALLSAISPFLWGINSRVNRARPIAPSRRFWHPVRSVALIRHMAWEGIALEPEGIASMISAPQPIAQKTDAELVTDFAEQAGMPLDAWQKHVVDQYFPERETGTKAEILESVAPRERAPRGQVSENMRAAVLALVDADNPLSVKDAAEKHDVARSTLGRYGTVLALLRDDPQRDLPAALAGRVKPELVGIIRDAANRGRAR
jgi:hypothetical protein